MKLLGTLGLLLLASIAAIKADDFLANSDFSNGGAGWSGDATDAVGASDPFSKVTPSSGLTLPLHSEMVTRIYQIFRTSDAEVTFTLVCTPSPGCKFTGTGKVARVASDLNPESPSTTFQNGNGQWQTFINGNYQDYVSSFSTATLLIVNRDKNEVYPYPLRIDPASTQSQTITMPMGFNPHQEYKLYIAFPPGEGNITLNKVSLVKGQAAITPNAPPFPSNAENLLAKPTWSGDVAGNDEDMGGLGSTSSGSTGDITVQLHGSKVTRISTTFRAPAPYLNFTITCALSSHYEYAGMDPLPTVGDVVRQSTNDSSGESSPFASDSAQPAPAIANSVSKMPIMGAVTLILVDQKTKNVSADVLTIQGFLGKTQTASTSLSVTPNDDYTLYLAFAPARGSVTINHVYLTKADNNAPGTFYMPPTNPPQR